MGIAVGVKVSVGVKVAVSVGVEEGVKVNVGVNVKVGVGVIVGCCRNAGKTFWLQAESIKKRINKINPDLRILSPLEDTRERISTL
jgi:hypothetical protein